MEILLFTDLDTNRIDHSRYLAVAQSIRTPLLEIATYEEFQINNE